MRVSEVIPPRLLVAPKVVPRSVGTPLGVGRVRRTKKVGSKQVNVPGVTGTFALNEARGPTTGTEGYNHCVRSSNSKDEPAYFGSEARGRRSVWPGENARATTP